jgi:TPR repeat protein
MEDLARHKFPPAMYAWGRMLRDGDLVPKDAEQGLALISKAADKNYGPALYDIGRTYLDGQGSPTDKDRGMRLVRDAAVLGSVQAQYFLGVSHETGTGVPRDPDQARRYFRLCAAANGASCQFRIAELLLNKPDRGERDYIQAIAWLQLAADQGLKEASAIVDVEVPKLTKEQIGWVNNLKNQLIQK